MATESEILQKLNHIVATQKVANAYLLLGGTKESRLQIAEQFAKQLVTSPADLIRPQHEKPNLFSVDDVRAEINANVYIAPYGSGKKVYLVDDADKMNAQAQNALLKTLEEPPEYVVIVLLAQNKESMLQTILSRAVKLSISEEGAAAGRDTQILELMRKGKRITSQDVLLFAKENEKEKDRTFLDFLKCWFRDVLFYKSERQSKGLRNNGETAAIKEFAEAISYAGINRILEEITRTAERLDANVNYQNACVVLFEKIRTEMEAK